MGIFSNLFKRAPVRNGLPGVIVTVPRSYLETLQAKGSCIAGNVCIVPINGVMERMYSKDGQVLIRGAGYVLESIVDSMRLSDACGVPGFKWHDKAFFDELDMPVEASTDDINLCKSLKFLIWNEQKSSDGWVVLQSLIEEGERTYAAGRIIDGKLFLVRDGMDLRVPEEASSFCLRNLNQGHEIPDQSSLFDLAHAIENNDPNFSLHDIQEEVYSGAHALRNLRADEDNEPVTLRPWPKDKRNEPYEL